MNKKFEGYVIYSDMDGTLLTDDKKVTKENADAINYFTQNGGKFSIATGRAIEATEMYIKDFDINLPAIVYNGGMIASSDEIIYEKILEDYQKELVYKVARDYEEIGIEVYCETDIFVFKNNNMSDRSATNLLNLHYDIPEDLFSRKWNKIILVSSEDYTNKVLNEFKDKYNEPVVKSGDFYLEILPKDTSKGSGLKKVMEIYNLDKDKVIAVGDNMNDYEMLKTCGIPFCPKNSNNEIKKICKYLTDDNNHHVIAHIVNELERIIK